jgi:hypothetical protein
VTLLHAEYLKLTRRKLYVVMLIILAALVGLLALLFIVLPQVAPEFASESELPVFEKPEAYVFGAQQVAGQTWFPLILAVVMLGSEFGSTVWATALTRDPRRIPQITARFVILALAAWVAILLAISGWAVLTALIASGEGGPSAAAWLGLVWKVGLVELAWTAIGLGAVAMLRSVGPAIGAALAFYFVDSILVVWPTYRTISLTAATNSLFQIEIPGNFGSLFGLGLPLEQAVAVVLGWTVVGLVLAWWGLQRRDA